MRLLWIPVLLLCAGNLQAASLTLEDCLALAGQHNPDLLGVADNPAIARAGVKKSRSAYLPRVDLSAGYTTLKDPQAIVIGSLHQPTQEADFAHASLGVRQTLYDFGRSAGDLDEARANLEAEVQNVAARRQEVRLQTVIAYYGVLAAKQLEEAAIQEVEQVSEHLRVTGALFDEGMVTRNDRLQAEVQLADSRQSLLGVRNALDNAWLQLNYLTGRPADSRDTLLAEPQSATAEPATAPLTLVDARPDILSEKSRVEADRQKLRSSRSHFYPELYLRGGIDYVQNDRVAEQTIYSATVALSVNLYEGGATSASVERSSRELARTSARLEALRQRAGLEVQQAVNDSEVAREQIAVARQAIDQGEENLRINRNRYQEQVGTATEVLDALTLLSRARTAAARATFNFQVALARLKAATGTL